ncbi:MAG: peroxiredoxin [Caulobacteraceae bacterium]|nr:peroxiredoxin [Caulobacteraceae bacterium]
MKKTLSPLIAALSLAASGPAHAALAVGAPAPEFATQATLAGKAYPYDLDEALKQGPVVLYFFPAAFTSGCTIEAHDFAEAIDQYKALGATVIGVTAGNVDRLAEFSTSECRSKFPVAADADLKIAKSYDATLAMFPGHSNRTSYVITPDHKIAFVYSDLNPAQHVATTLGALKSWRAAHPQ